MEKEKVYARTMKKYANKWVAMNSQQTKVVASASDPGKVLEKARRLGFRKPVITFVVKDYGYLIP